MGCISIYNLNEKSNMEKFRKFIFGCTTAILDRSTKKNLISNYWLYEIGSNC